MVGINQKSGAEPELEPVSKPSESMQEPNLVDLARGILSREIRPRVADVRRLAEAILASEARPGKESKQAKGKKGKGDAGKKAGGKKRKLAKIPRPKSKK